MGWDGERGEGRASLDCGKETEGYCGGSCSGVGMSIVLGNSRLEAAAALKGVWNHAICRLLEM